MHGKTCSNILPCAEHYGTISYTMANFALAKVFPCTVAAAAAVRSAGLCACPAKRTAHWYRWRASVGAESLDSRECESALERNQWRLLHSAGEMGGLRKYHLGYIGARINTSTRPTA